MLRRQAIAVQDIPDLQVAALSQLLAMADDRMHLPVGVMDLEVGSGLILKSL